MTEVLIDVNAIREMSTKPRLQAFSKRDIDLLCDEVERLRKLVDELAEENVVLKAERHQLGLELARQNVYYTVSEVVDALHVRGYIPAPDYIAEYAFCLLEEDAKFVKQHDFHGVVFTWAGMEHMIAMYVRRP